MITNFRNYLIESENSLNDMDYIMESMSLQAIGDELGISKQGVDQIVNKSISKLYWGFRKITNPWESVMLLSRLSSKADNGVLWNALKKDPKIRAEIQKELKNKQLDADDFPLERKNIKNKKKELDTDKEEEF